MRLTILLALVVSAGAAFAQPVLTSVAADTAVVQGNTLTITGTGFGTKAQAAPLRWDDFQGGTPSACTDPPCDPIWTSATTYTDQNLLNFYDGVFDVQPSPCRHPYYSNLQERFSGDVSVAQDFWSIEHNCGSNRAIAVLNEPSKVWYISHWTYQDDYEETATFCTNAKIRGNFARTPWSSAFQARWDEYWDQNGTGLPGSDPAGDNDIPHESPGGHAFSGDCRADDGNGLIAAAVAAGGSGYSVGDTLTILGSDPIVVRRAHVQVATIGAGGAVTSFANWRMHPWWRGRYQPTTANPMPGNPLSVSGGSGDGATINATWANNIVDFGVHNTGGVYRDIRNQWVRTEIILDFGDWGVANGYHAGFYNGEQIFAYSGQFTPPDESWCANTPYLGSFHFGHYFRSGDNPPPRSFPLAAPALMVQYISELYVDHTPARVELGDAPTWAACTHREIQIPSAWSATEITVTVNQGAFEAEDDVWLYVVDAGRVNNTVGYPLVIGGEPASEPEQVGIPGPVIFDGEEASVSWTAPVDLGVPAYYGVYLVKDGTERRVGVTAATYMDRIPATNGMELYVVAYNEAGQVFSQSETVEVVEWR